MWGKRSWFELELRVRGVSGTGETWRGSMIGTRRECRSYAANQHPGVGYRIVKHTVHEERDGTLTSDHLREFFRAQVWSEVHDYVSMQADADVGRVYG